MTRISPLLTSSSVMTSILSAVLLSILFGLLLLFPSPATAASRPAVAKSPGKSTAMVSTLSQPGRPASKKGEGFCPVDYALITDGHGRRFGWGHFWDATTALQRALDFFDADADKANVDALIGARMAEGQLKALYGHMKENLRSVSSKTLRKAAAVTRKILKKLASIAERILGAVSLTEPEYLSSMLPVIQDDVWDKLDYPSQELSLEQEIDPSRPINIDRRADTAKEQESDYCLKELVGTADRENGAGGGGSGAGSSSMGQRCRISKQCWVFMTAPKRSGYTLTHEVLYLQVGEMFGCERQMRKLARRTYGKDLNELKQSFCADVFKEVLSEAQQCFPEHLKDLFMEQIALCGIYGFRNFFTEQWLQKIISWQKPSGCFAFKYPEVPLYSFKMLDPNGQSWYTQTEPTTTTTMTTTTTTSTTTTTRPPTTTTRPQKQKQRTKQKQKVKTTAAATPTTAKPALENDFGVADAYNSPDQANGTRPMLPPDELAKDLTNFKQMLHYEDMPHPDELAPTNKFVGFMNGKNNGNPFEQFYFGGNSAKGKGTKVIAQPAHGPIFGVKVMTPEDRKAFREQFRTDDNTEDGDIRKRLPVQGNGLDDMRRNRRGEQLGWPAYQLPVQQGIAWPSEDLQQLQPDYQREVLPNSIISQLSLRELEAAALLAAGNNPHFISTSPSASPRWSSQQLRRIKREETLMDDGCMSHATALGIDSLSMHLRYIWEDIYAKNDLMK